MTKIDTFTKAFHGAIAMLEMFEDLEPRSALKQSASDHGISYGKDMEEFVLWAESKMYS